MGTTGSARHEAERLVATVLAMAAQGGAGRGLGALTDALTGIMGQAGGHRPGGGWATGAAECCVCPLCRVIAALRDPSPEVAERLATGAGDFAAGLASLLRAFSALGGASADGAAAAPTQAAPAPTQPGPQRRTGDDLWAAATAGPPRDGAPPDVWAAATRTRDGGSGTGSAADRDAATGDGAQAEAAG